MPVRPRRRQTTGQRNKLLRHRLTKYSLMQWTHLPHPILGTASRDFHPWQSLAYTSMAGVDFNKVKVKNHSLKDLAFNSVWINKNKGEESFYSFQCLRTHMHVFLNNQSNQHKL